jgi:hypothetical protein
VNFTTSIGVSDCPILPPIVPLIPDIDLINAIIVLKKVCWDYEDKILNVVDATDVYKYCCWIVKILQTDK